jgi:hypothetical protein
VAFPNVLAGQVSVNTSTELLGADVYLRRNLFTTAGGGQLDGLVGYRFLQMRETLGVAEALVSLEQSPLAPPVGTTFDILDQFRTSNYFHGGDIGLQYQVAFDRISIDVMARVAFGCTQRNTRIQGGTRVTQPGAAPEDLVGGLLALESNIGSHSSSGFSVVPELRLNVGYQITSRLRAFVGYNFLYWTNVARAGEQVDLRVNPSLVPPSLGGDPRLPAFTGQSSGFWAQGINFGLAFNY